MGGQENRSVPVLRASPKHPVPRLKDEAAGAVFAEALVLFVFEDAERLAGEVGAVDVLGVEDVAELVAGQAVELRVVGVELGPKEGSSGLVPLEGGQADAAIKVYVGVGGAARPVRRVPSMAASRRTVRLPLPRYRRS